MRYTRLIKRMPPLIRAGTAIFLVTLVIYGIFLSRVFPDRVVFTKYQTAAEQYLAHQLPGERMLDFSPLYLYLNIAARKFADNPYHCLLRVQALLVSFSTVLLFLLLKLFFNWTLSLLGTALFITNKSLILYTRAFEPEPLLIFFILGFVYFATRVMVNAGEPGKLKEMYSSLFFAGLFLGLSILTRSNFLPLAFLTPLFLLFAAGKDKRKKDGRHRKWLRSTLIFGAPILMAFLFLILSNSFISGSFNLFAMNPGQVFFEGNNPNSWGESATYPPLVNEFATQFRTQADFQHVAYRLFARRISKAPLSIHQVNWFWTQKGLNFILDHPRHFLERALMKINFVFHNYRRHDLENVARNDQEVLKKVPSLPFALISAMALLGMLVSITRWKERALIYAAFFWQAALMILLYVSDRQRVVIVSMFVFFAMDFLNWLISKPKKSMAVLTVVSALAIVPLLSFENQLMKDETHLWQRYRLTNQTMARALRERKNGNLNAAVQQSALALAYAPWLSEKGMLAGLPCSERELHRLSLRLAVSFGAEDPSSLFDLGVLALESRNLDQAKYIFNLLTKEKYTFNRQYTQSSLPEFYQAEIYRLKGEKTAALSGLAKALKRNPGDPWVLARCYGLTGEPVYKETLFRYFDDIDARFFLGRALLDSKKFPEAVRCFSYVKEKLPQYRRGLIYLSIGLGHAGRYGEAVENYFKAMALSGDPVFAEEEIIRIFEANAAQDPGDFRAKHLLKMVLNQFGSRDYTDSLNPPPK